MNSFIRPMKLYLEKKAYIYIYRPRCPMGSEGLTDGPLKLEFKPELFGLVTHFHKQEGRGR